MKPELLYGVHPVSEALAAGRRKIHEVILAPGRAGEPAAQLRQRARGLGIDVREADAAFFKKLPPGNQGVAARVGPCPEAHPDDMLELAAQKGEDPFLLVADGIEDPGNLGALVRTALCAGVHGVVTPIRRAAPLSPAVSKASAGALEHSLVARVVNLTRALAALKDSGLWIFGADSAGDKTLWDAGLTGPAAIVVGGEGRGLSRLVAESCDFLVNIPQAGPLGSLNASVAGALVLYEAMRQRRRKNP